MAAAFQQTHYFLQPEDVQSHGTDQLSPCNPLVPLFGGLEPRDMVEARYQLYTHHWTRQRDKGDTMLREVNTELFDLLHQFVDREFDTCKMPMAMLKLSTNTANNARIILRFILGLKSEYKAVSLSSKYFANIKMVMREMMRQVMDELYTQLEDEDDLVEAKGDKLITQGRLNYDVDILPDWYEVKRPQRVVIVVEDTNKVNKDTLNELIIVCSLLGLPIRWVLGVSLTAMSEWINDNLLTHARSLVQAFVFEGANNSNLGFRILEELFLRDPQFLMDSKLSTILLKRFEYANNSVDLLIAEIKLCYMIHFFQLPLSVYFSHCPMTPEYIDGLRKLPLFKKYVELTGDTTGLKDDTSLIDLFVRAKQEFADYKQEIMDVIDTVTKIAKGVMKVAKFEIYHALVDGRFITSLVARTLVQKIDPNLELAQLLEELFRRQFRAIDLNVFYEIFTLNGGLIWQRTELVENFENLTLRLIRPKLRELLEQALCSAQLYLNCKTQPLLVILFNIYREAPITINIYDFYTTFRALINRLEFDVVDDATWNEMTYAWFLQNCTTLIQMGLLKEKPKGDYLEKGLWRGI